MRALLLACAPLLAAAQDNPVKKVVSLLTEMHNTMEQEQKDDAKLYAKMECWCRTNRKAKTAAVEAAQKKVKQLNQAIEEATGTIGKSTEQIKRDAAKIAEKQKELGEATALRKKERDEAAGLQQEFKETIDALGRALKALEKVNSFSQTDVPTLMQIAKTAESRGYSASLQKDLWDVLGSIQPARGFLQAEMPEEDFSKKKSRYGPGKYDQAAMAPNANSGAVAGAKSYNSQSGGIFGLLGQMNDDFNRDLNKSIADEKAADSQFETMRQATNDEIAATKASKQAAEKNLGDAKMARSNAKTEKKNTQAELTSDEQFIVNMEKSCKEAAEGFKARSTTRGDEIQAVGKAIEILTSDESRDLFNKTFTGFVQLRAVSAETSNKTEVRQKLALIAKKSGNAQIAAIAMSAQLDAFVKVKAALDKLHAELKTEQEEEFQQRDQCRSDLNDNTVANTDAETKASDTQDTIEDLSATIEKLSGEIKNLNAEIAATRTSMQQAGADRAAESQEFQTTVRDQRLTVHILNQALTALEGFYGKQALLQKAGEAVSPMPERAADYGKSQAAPGALGLIKMIIADAHQMTQEATADEQKAQADYEQMIRDSNEAITNATNSINTKKGERAAAGVEKENNEATLAELNMQLDNLAKENASLHKACDFLLKNFSLRQDAREAEMESIQQAKSVLSGASYQ